MSLLPEISRRAHLIISPIIGLMLVSYFTYFIINGERGLIAWAQLKQKIAVAEKMAESTQLDRAYLEHEVSLLRPENLDPDMLEERSRLILNVGRDDEMIIFARPS